MFNRQAVNALKGLDSNDSVLKGSGSNDSQAAPIRRFLRPRRQGAATGTANLPPPSPGKRKSSIVVYSFERDILQSIEDMHVILTLLSFFYSPCSFSFPSLLSLDDLYILFDCYLKGFLHLLKLGLTPSKKKASKSERKLSTVIHSPLPATAGTNKGKQPESYLNAFIKEKSSLSYSSSSHASPSHSSPSNENVTPRRRVFQRQTSHSSLAHMVMTPHEIDRSQDINLDNISLDVSHDISHDDYNDDYELHHDEDLDIERYRFLKSFNRNKFARGANREVDFLLDLDVHHEDDSFHYDGKVLEFANDD